MDYTSKVYIKYIVQILFFSTIFYGCYIFYIAAMYKPFDSNILWVDNMLAKKVAMFSDICSPKLVLTGGSGTLFGLSALQIEKTTGIRTVNFATSAALGTDYVLERTKQVLHPGDTVLYPVEISLLLDEKKYYSAYVNFILATDKSYINSLPLYEKMHFFTAVSPWLILNNFFDPDSQPHQESVEVKVYHSQAINSHGDEIMNLQHNSAAISSLKPFYFTSTIPTGNMKQIVTFANWCKQNKIRFIVSFANTVDFSVYHDRNSNFALYSSSILQYFAQHGVDVMGSPQDFLFPACYFFDTQYHLTLDGVTLRTSKLVSEFYQLF